jgi:hypothetical protein
MMGAENSNSEQTLRLVMNPERSPPPQSLEPVLVGEQRKGSFAGLVNQQEDTAKNGIQSGKGARTGGEPYCVPKGHLNCEPEGKRGARGVKPKTQERAQFLQEEHVQESEGQAQEEEKDEEDKDKENRVQKN